MRKIVFLVLLSLCIIPVLCFGEIQSVTKPIKEHPRLFLTSKDINTLRKKTQNSNIKPLYNRLLSQSMYSREVNDIFNDYKNSKISLTNVRTAFENNALFYVLQLNPKDGTIFTQKNDLYGKRAISLLKLTLEQLNKKEDYSEYFTSQNIGRTLLGGAMVYDWCYDLLSSSEKASLIKNFEKLASKMELSYPPNELNALVGHSSGSPLMVELLGTGIATYDEKPDMYNLISDWYFKEVVPARNFFYSSGMHNQGDSYGWSRYDNEILSALMFKRMGFDNIFSENQRKVPYRWIYSRRPDGQLLRDGDTFMNITPYGEYWAFPLTYLYTAAYYQDTYLNNELQRHYYPQGSFDAILEFLFIDADLYNTSIEHLPLTRFFGYPMGSMICRTGWDTEINSNSKTVVAEMKIGVYQFSNHQHLDSGHFQIYYKGALAIDSGIYDGTEGAYGSDHDINYYKRTIAHNSLLIYDPQEEFYFHTVPVANDGGQRWPSNANGAATLDELTSKDFKTGQVNYYGYGPDKNQPEYSYMTGNLSLAYTSKVNDYSRSFVFLNLDNSTVPASLIVYDKVESSKKEFKKTWLLHSIEEPEIKGTQSIIRRTASETGNMKYNGKLVNTTLLPKEDNVKITKVGGPGKEYLVNSKNYENYPSDDGATESGSWRLEITPKEASKSDEFLNVMQVMDNTDSAGNSVTPLNVEQIDTTDFTGVKIQDRLVMFNKNKEVIKNSFNLNINWDKETKCLLTQIGEGSWIVEKDGKLYKQLVSTPDEGVLYFSAEKGNYTIYPSTEENPCLFTDLYSVPWASTQIEELFKQKLISGKSKYIFSPKENITRADFTLLLVNALSLDAEISNEFRDVQPSDYFYKPVGIARELGIISGVEEYKFGPYRPITREEMFTIASKALNIAGKIDLSGNNDLLDRFKDRNNISAYAQNSISALINKDLVTGSNGFLYPKNTTNRAEAAVFIYNILKFIDTQD